MQSSIPPSTAQRIWNIMKWGILGYFLLGAAFYFLQDYILFHPEPLQKNNKYGFSFPYLEINIPYDHQTNLNIIEFKTDHAVVRGIVLYFHGNKKNIGWYAKYAPVFTSKGYELWMMDYPGYGKSTGKFTEGRLYDFSLQLYKLARTRFEPNHIIIYGKSLGTGIASQLASVRDCKRLILETPYYSLETLVGHFLPFFPISLLLQCQLSNYEYLPQVTAPVSIFHGTSDWLVPYSNAQKLKPLLKLGDEFITIDKGGHNDLDGFEVFRNKLDSLLSL
jgi:pimeloyl-ACP methyl ester carboxylesterase